MRRLVIALVAAVIGLAALGAAQPYGPSTTNIELRVWQGLDDGTDIAIGARAIDGSWHALGMVPLPLDDGFSANGDYRYGQTSVGVPLTSAALLTVEVRVWQAVRVQSLIYVSARGAGGSWGLLGTVRLRLDDGLRPDPGYRYGDIRIEVELPEERVVTLAGRAKRWGYVDDRAEDALFGSGSDTGLMGLAVDHDGSVVVADARNDAIRRISLDGTVTTIAGGNGRGSLDGPGDTAQFFNPADVAVDPEGAIYVADSGNNRIRKIAPDGAVTTVAGGGPPATRPSRVRDGPASEALFSGPHGIAIDAEGNLYIIEQYRIRRLTPSGRVSTFAGRDGPWHLDGAREAAKFAFLQAIDIDAAGNIYVIDANPYISGKIGTHYTIRMIDTRGVVRTLYQNQHPSFGGILASPQGLAVGAGGEVYVANTGRNQILRLTDRGQLRAVAGTGRGGYLDGAADAAAFSQPGSLAASGDGGLMVVDQEDSVVRAIVPGEDGLFDSDLPLAHIGRLPRLGGVSVTTFAGRSGHTYYGTPRFRDGRANLARFDRPWGMALDAAGNVIVADSQNHAIRRISTDGTVSTLAGGNGEGSRDGAGDEAQFSWPEGVVVDANGCVYVADSGNSLIRKIAPDGAVSTVAIEGLNGPSAMVFDSNGNLFVAETYRIWQVTPSGAYWIVESTEHGFTHGITVDDEDALVFVISEIPDSAIRRITADGERSTVFQDRPGRFGGVFSDYLPGIARAPDGAIYATDWGFGRVVRIAPDGTAAIVADRDAFGGTRHFHPAGILVTPEGDLLVSDSGLNAIWKITFDEDAER